MTWFNDSPNGDVLKAQFKEGQATGLGTLTDKSNKIIHRGSWIDGNFKSALKPAEESQMAQVEKIAMELMNRTIDFPTKSGEVTGLQSKNDLPQITEEKKKQPKKAVKKVKDTLMQEAIGTTKSNKETTNEPTPEAPVLAHKKKSPSKSKDAKGKKIKKIDVKADQ